MSFGKKLIVSLPLLINFILMLGLVEAKSVYVISDTEDSNLAAYKIEDANLVYQANYVCQSDPSGDAGAVGLAIDESEYWQFLFVTFEGENTIELVNAKAMEYVDTVTATGASNLAGIVADQTKQKVYVVDRGEKYLYVYDWYPNTPELVQGGNRIELEGLVNNPIGGAWGIALDEENSHLYVASRETKVRYYNTSDWSHDPNTDYITVSHEAVGIAVDPNRYVYTGCAQFCEGTNLSQYDLSAGAENTPVDVGSRVLGIAVDQDTSLIYITTYSGGTNPDKLIIYDSNLVEQPWDSGGIGSPAGVAVVGDVSYKPPLLVLTKDDNDASCVVPGDYITYTISYDANDHDVNDVNIIDYLPDEVDFNSASGPDMTYDSDSNTVTWKIGPLSPTDSNSVTLTVKVNECILGCGTITNFCEAESDSTYNNAEASTPVCSASNPEPTCGAIVVDDVGEFNLTWCPGLFAADVNGHEVYFGSNFIDVNDANNLWPIGGVYKGPVTNPSYPIEFSNLHLDTTYYWRIDEVDDPNVWRGGVWSFTTGNYFVVVVEDFNSYADHAALRAVWKDYYFNPAGKNGAEVFIETDLDFVRDGQSMRYYFRNTNKVSGQYVGSEAEANTADLEAGTDWVSGGVEALVLYFYGDITNLGDTSGVVGGIHQDQMYVALEDGSANVGVVRYPDMNDITEEEWHEWNIDLEDPCLTDVNLADVAKVYIGFGGQRIGQTAAGAGKNTSIGDTVWFDDIRLYRMACLIGGNAGPLEHSDWVAWGEPNCWCYRKQCRGDTDGKLFLGKPVSLVDWNLVKNSFNKLDANLPPNGICADLDHKKFLNKRVTLADWNIIKAYFNDPDANVPACDEPNVITGPYNFWVEPDQSESGGGESATEPVDIEALIEWLEELWLTEQEIREQFSEDDWLEFIETVRETPVY